MLADLDVLAQRKQQELKPMDTDDASMSASLDAQVITASPVSPCSPRDVTFIKHPLWLSCHTDRKSVV